LRLAYGFLITLRQAVINHGYHFRDITGTLGEQNINLGLESLKDAFSKPAV
jgi:hypothetical protein